MCPWRQRLHFLIQREKKGTKVCTACSKANHVYVSTILLYSTFLMEYPFHIKLRATLNGTKLYVKEMNSEHNHELSKVC